MGMPGNIYIEITTVFDVEKGSVTRSVRCVDGWGLNFLVASDLDTIALPDGQHKVDLQHVGPGQFDYKWMPVTANDE